MSIAFFDFDGTITKKDSLMHFTAFAKGRFIFYTGMLLLSPVFFCFKLGFVNAEKMKNIFISWFFKNENINVFNKTAHLYASGILNSIVRQTILEKIQWHKTKGHRVIVVSASPEAYLKEWCYKMNIECIGTKLQSNGQRLTGKIDGYNCNGSEKARRILAEIDIHIYDQIFGYGNSAGDKEMLALCNKIFYVRD